MSRSVPDPNASPPAQTAGAAEQTLSIKLSGRIGALSLGLDFVLPARGVCVLFGPSGAGKSVTLRAIAGLQPGLQGEIRIGAQSLQSGVRATPAHQRRIAWMSQRPQLFEHLDVEGNLRFALQRGRIAADERSQQLQRHVRSCGIEHLLTRRVDRLSGGEAQRVALCRALLSKPRWLLLDEPFSALDRSARDALCRLLRKLSVSESLPMLLVTHSLDEVERVADFVLLMKGGQSGPLLDLPAALAAPDIGLQAPGELAAVFDLAPSAEQQEEDLLSLTFEHEQIRLPWSGPAPSGPLRLRIAARDVTLWREPPPPSSAQNCLLLLIEQLIDSHSADAAASAVQRLVIGRCGEQRLFARITRAAERQLQLAPGQTVYAQFKAVALL